MAKFTVVKEAPTTLEKGEFVVEAPNFLEQVEANVRKAPKNGLTAVHHLREILNSVAEKYDHDMNPLAVKLVNYVGLPYNSNQDLSAIVTRILRNEYPAIFDKVITHNLAKRPMGTKLVYYTGEFTTTSAFYAAGLDLIEAKEIESYMSGKPKKTVGKPAVSNENTNE